MWDLPNLRLIKEGMATLTELETTWSLDDLVRGIAYLDMIDDLTRESRGRLPNGA